MRFFVALAAVGALLFVNTAESDAAKVVAFSMGDSSTESFGGGLVTVTNTKVIRENGIATSSAAPDITSILAGGERSTSFTASFSTGAPVPLLWFDFGAAVDPGKTASYQVDFETAAGTVSKSGVFTTAGATDYLDLAGLGPVNSGSIQFELTDAVFNQNLTLPKSGIRGAFASVTAVPEPSTVVGLALLSGIGLVIHRRRRVAKLG